MNPNRMIIVLNKNYIPVQLKTSKTEREKTSANRVLVLVILETNFKLHFK